MAIDRRVAAENGNGRLADAAGESRTDAGGHR